MGGGRQIDEHMQQRVAGQTGGFAGIEPDVQHIITNHSNIGTRTSHDGSAAWWRDYTQGGDQEGTIIKD